MKSKTATRRTPRKKSSAKQNGEGSSDRSPSVASDQAQAVGASVATAESTEAQTPDVTAVNVSPLDYMLGVMRDPAVEPERRDEMAKLALPYMHPKVSVPDGGKQTVPAEPTELSEIDLARRVAFMMALAGRDDSGQH